MTIAPEHPPAHAGGLYTVRIPRLAPRACMGRKADGELTNDPPAHAGGLYTVRIPSYKP
jgi:hypothetical protein